MQGARLETTLAIIQVRNDASLHWGGTGGSGKWWFRIYFKTELKALLKVWKYTGGKKVTGDSNLAQATFYSDLTGSFKKKVSPPYTVQIL